jgi:integration host factor subunit beta
MSATATASSSVQKSMFMDTLIANLAVRFPDLTDDDIALSVEIIIGAMSERLISGGRIELRGFGSFSLNAQMINACKNAMRETNDYVPQSHAVVFKPGQVIREIVNNMA